VILSERRRTPGRRAGDDRFSARPGDRGARHWNTVTLDGSVPEDELLDLIGHSYELVVARLTRAERGKLTR
jgi:hypothetical protein